MKRLVSLAISVFLIALLVRHVDRAALLANLASTRWGIFAAALVLFVPQTVVIAWRWKLLVAPFTGLPLADSVRMVLAGATMNLVLPGKMGDLTKGWFLARSGSVSTALGLGVVVFEKMLDVAALAVFMLSGVALIVLFNREQMPIALPSLVIAGGLAVAAIGAVALLYFVPLDKLPGVRALGAAAERNPRLAKLAAVLTRSHATMTALRERGARRGTIIGMSLLIWLLHLAQIYLFFLSLNLHPPAGQFFSMVPLAIFIGLLPISIAGFGTRDAALVALLPGMASSGVLAAALYINLRYIIPALAGIPFLARYATRKQPAEPPAN